MSDKNIEPKGSFWTTAPGCITAIGGLVSVVVAAVVALSAAGFIQPPFTATATSPAPVVATVPNSNSVVLENAPAVPNTEPSPTNTAASAVPQLVIEFDNQDSLWDSNCNSIRQDMNPFGGHLWRERDQLFGAGLNCDMGFEIKVSQTGFYQVTLFATYAPDFGRLRLTFTRGSTSDDIFHIDLFDPAVRPTGAIDLGNWRFTAGDTNQFILIVKGKNDASIDYKFGLDYMTFDFIQRGLP